MSLTTNGNHCWALVCQWFKPVDLSLKNFKNNQQKFFVFFFFSLAIGHCSVSFYLLTYESCPSLSHTVTLKIFIDRAQIPLRELFGLCSSGSMVLYPPNLLCNVFILAKMFCIRKLFLCVYIFLTYCQCKTKQTKKQKEGKRNEKRKW